jgi:predicted helicase
MTVFPHPPYSPDLAPFYFSVSRHFDEIEMIEAESQTVLNTFTEHDFQHGFKKMAEVLGMVHAP